MQSSIASSRGTAQAPPHAAAVAVRQKAACHTPIAASIAGSGSRSGVRRQQLQHGAPLLAGVSLRRQQRRARNTVPAAAEVSEGTAPLVAVEGDVVQVEYVCKDPEGNVVGSSQEDGEPATFEIGAGEVVGNKLFKAFDEAVRGLALGDEVVLKASGGEWSRDLLFDVPPGHQEIEKLSQRYKTAGGLVEGLVVELSNGQPAVVVAITPEAVRLDANGVFAGRQLVFELKLTGIEKGV